MENDDRRRNKVSNNNFIIKKQINGFGISKGAKSFEEDKEEHPEFW